MFNATAALAANFQVRINAALPAAEPTPTPGFGFDGGDVMPAAKEAGANFFATVMFIMAIVFTVGFVVALAATAWTKQSRNRAMIACAIGVTVCGGAGGWAIWIKDGTESIFGI